MRFKLLISACLILAGHLVAAQTIRARVIDSITGEPVSYAAIQYAPEAGIISNEEGFFQLRPGPGNYPELLISCLGYENRVIPVTMLNEGENVIKLKEAVVRLSGVLLSDKVPDAEAIMEKVRERIDENYQASNKTHHIFSRQTDYIDFEEMDFEVARSSEVSKDGLKRTNRELDSLARVIMQSRAVHFRDYLGDLHFKDAYTSKLEVEKATSLVDSKKDFSLEKIQEKAQQIVLQYLDTSQTYKLKTGILKIEDSLDLQESFDESEKPLEYKTESLRSQTLHLINTSHFFEDSFLDEFLGDGAYDFSYNKATFLNDELIYVLDYKPGKGRSKYTGQVFINGNDYGLVKINYQYARGKRGKKLNMKLLLGVKYLEDTDSGTILFKKSATGTYDPYYIQRTSGNYFYVNRPVKFIENSSDRDKVKFNFIIAGNSRNKEELLITATSGMEDSDFQGVVEREKIQVIELNKYDQTIWQNAETIQPLEEMRQFNAME